MSRNQGTKEYSTFVKGLITEASPLTFPEDASLDEDNMVLERDGTRRRRLGMAYEDGYTAINTTYTSTAISDYAVSVHRWDNVSDNADLSLCVVQVGPKLWFFDLFKDLMSANMKNSGSPITLSINGDNPIQTAEANGYLVIVTGETDPLYLEYDSTTDTVSQSTIDLKIRDFFGADDGYEEGFRPSTLTAAHLYNLLNQGWSTTNNSIYSRNKINAFFSGGSGLGVYPSNSDLITTGQYVDVSSGVETWSPAQYNNKFEAGTSPAPKGRIIIDAFTRGSDRNNLTETGVTGLPTDREEGRPSSVVSHAGRIFYSGINSHVVNGDDKSPNYDGFIFFTRILRNTADFGRCYQEADPTAEFVSDLVATDGGYISIPEAYNIRKLISLQDSLIVLADNGVWEVHGGDLGFSANEYIITKTTDLGCISASSVVDVEDGILYWSKGGIYTLAPDRISGRFAPTNITETTIQTLYNEIPSAAKQYAVGNFDPQSRKVSWLYNDGVSYTGATYRNKYNRELVIDTVLSAFYTNTIPDTDPFLAGYIQTPNFLTQGTQDDVVIGGDLVQVNADDVYIDTTERVGTFSTTKYLALASGTTYTFSFCHYWKTDFLDWGTTDAAGYLVTGYELMGSSIVDKGVPYLFVHCRRTEDGYDGNLNLTSPSSCKVQAQWGWTDSANSGRWGTEFQAYRLLRPYYPSGPSDPFDYGFSVITTKNKLRGKGKAVSIKFSTEAGKDLQLLGWAIAGTMETVP